MALQLHYPLLLSSSPTPSSSTSSCIVPSDHRAVLELLEGRCTDLSQLKQIHARMLRLSIFSDPFSASRLITAACALCPSPPHQDYALRVFEQIPHPNLYTWNILIRAHASGPDPRLSLRLFSRLLCCTTHSPDKFTYPFAIKAAAEISALQEGAALHGSAAKSPFCSDVFILNSLIRFYAACGKLDLSFRVFDKFPGQRDVVSWNSMIAAFMQAGYCDEALGLFREMENENISPNDVTMISLLSACGKKGDLELGRWLHSYIKRNAIEENLILCNAMLDMYTKCGSMADAKLLFDGMMERDSISWTTILVGYAKSGEFDAAQCVFNEMPSHDIASWNALISGYEQNGCPREALVLFHKAQRANTKPDQVTLVAALSACAQVGAMELGSWIHAYIRKNRLELNCHLTTSLIDMYSKCGDLDMALDVFRSADRRDVFVWSAMIAGLAMHGKGRAALDLFSQMQEAKVKPNHVTFTNILCACSHAGLVEEGRLYFSQMLSVYGIVPKVDHYSCMVDILGRAGHLEEAMELINNMPLPPGPTVWGALLGACAIHNNVELGEHACKHLLELEPRNDGAYVLLSNLYAKCGNWDGVARLRKLMKNTELRKEPGCSSIEIRGIIHEFLVGDTSHPLLSKIYAKLDEITAKLRDVGYIPDRTQLLQDIEEDDVKDKALNLHSEKLAIAFGLISAEPHAPIRISKNLRICEDCHSAAKLISRLYNRHIYLRDRYRFHHFEDGQCSCMDYW